MTGTGWCMIKPEMVVIIHWMSVYNTYIIFIKKKLSYFSLSIFVIVFRLFTKEWKLPYITAVGVTIY